MPRVTDPADPRRCKGVHRYSQCWEEALDGDFCGSCMGGSALENAEEKNRRLYHLTEARYRARLAQLTEHEHTTALRETIALARMLIEQRFNLAVSNPDFIEAIGSINTLQLTVERLCKSAHQIEQDLSVLLSKPTVLRLGQLVIHIVADVLESIEGHEQIVSRIAPRMIQSIATANNTVGDASIQRLLACLAPAKSDEPSKGFMLEKVDQQVRLGELTTHTRIKSLNEDIGMSIIMIERRWNLVKTDDELIAACPQLNAMLRTLDKQIKSAHQIEQTLGELLQPDAQRKIGQSISQILIDELQMLDGYEDLIDDINDRLIQSLTNPKLAEQRLLTS